MRVQVLFFGILRDIVGRSGDEIEVPAAADVCFIIDHYVSQFPGLNELRPSLAVAINQQYSDRAAALQPGDEIALLPPVSGGLKNSEQLSEPRRVLIVGERIDTEGILHRIRKDEDGAVVLFEGIVRNQTRGRKALYLDYEAYEPMALRQMHALVEQALQQFKVRDVALVHRLGRLQVGETSVLVVVASAHRAPAFDACRWLIDLLKRTVPIWKKEYFEDGAVWADGEPFPAEIPRAAGSPDAKSASK